MDSSADRDCPRDVNPYQSPQWSGGDSAPEDVLRVYGQKLIRLRGALTLQHAKQAKLDKIGGPLEVILSIVVMGLQLFVVGVGVALAATSKDSSDRILAILIPLLMCIPLCILVLELLSTVRLRRLYREQRGIFEYQERTVIGDRIEAATRQGIVCASWEDYDLCTLGRGLVVLRLRRQALRRRRQARSGEPLSWLDRRLAFDRLDIFPREHFADELAWEAFVALAKRMSKR